MKKKLFALPSMTLAFAMLLGACGSTPATTEGTEPTYSSQPGDAAEDTAQAAVDTSKALTISIFEQADDNPEFTLENNPVINYWSDMYNLDVEWQQPPQGSEQTQLTMMLGTGDYTDVIDISFNQENLSTLWEDGVIYDLSPYIEKYMPNYYAFLNAPENADVKSALYDDEGHIYNVAIVKEEPKQWGGLVYRRDILETMTGGNVAFPSGESEPTTIEDMEYMMGLMKQYFDASGMPETASLIVPACGYFATGELMAGFGIGGLDYIDENGKAQYGIAQDNFYNYLVKMKQWYDEGYLYADFAARTQDPFYLPNTALTYGGAAGLFYGITQNLGDAMSMPDYGLMMDVRPMSAPADTENGVTTPLGLYLDAGRASNNSGFVITTACDEEKLIRILNAFDYFFSEEGAVTRTMGLSSAEGSAECESYVERGMADGTHKPGTREWTDAMQNDTHNVVDFAANRMPGIEVSYSAREVDLVNGIDQADWGNDVWTKYGNANVFPLAVAFTPEESAKINPINTNMQDYANGMIAKFIIGKENLTPETFKAYQDQLEALGLSDYLAIKQAAYDRFVARAQ